MGVRANSISKHAICALSEVPSDLGSIPATAIAAYIAEGKFTFDRGAVVPHLRQRVARERQ